MLSSVPDGDLFAKLGRLAAPVAHALRRTLEEGAVWDPSFLHRFLERSFVGGVPSLPGVVLEIEALANMPLLAIVPEEREISAEKIDLLTRGPKSQIALVLRSSAQRSVLQGQHDPVKMIKSFLLDVCDAAVISPRGGLVDQLGYECRQPALHILELAVADIAATLAARPETRRLRLPKYAVDRETNLLPEFI